MPKVSVIMPVYNTKEEFLRRSIESILQQTLSDIELIIINDGSTNNTKDIINSYQDKRIKYFSHEKNIGAGVSRNKGLSLALGEYILFVDSDDWIDLDTCSKTFLKAKEMNLDVLFFGFNFFDNKSKKLTTHKNLWEFIPDKIINNSFNFKHPLIISNLFNINATTCMEIFKKDFLIKNNLFFIEGLIFEDTEFFFRFILKATKIGFLKDACYFYRINIDNSVTQTKDIKVLDLIKIFKLIETNFIENQVFDFENLKIKFYNFQLKTLFSRYRKIKPRYKMEFKNNIIENLKTIELNKDEFKKLPITSQLLYKYFISQNDCLYLVLFNIINSLNKIKGQLKFF